MRPGCVIGLIVSALMAVGGCTPAAPVNVLALAGGDIMATTPAGYCFDPGASDPRDGFAVMAPCVTLGGGGAVPAAVGVATVQVGPAGSGAVAGAEPALRDLLVSDAGAVLLSTTGSADTIAVLGSQVSENNVTVHFTDSAPPPIAGLQREEWRAFLDMNGRLVTIAVRGLAGAPLQDGMASWLLDRVVKGVSAAGGDTQI
ncbi:dihydroxy-acid dehydratase [Yoonia sp.]|uniref:dihydroxy-acid dehydratase n=1 Tax=Yoonia sp. TaxID=2212373 RepID=UPI0025E1ECE4|nr:dihydroxy-acid dehydratase [Yoonia sp.]